MRRRVLRVPLIALALLCACEARSQQAPAAAIEQCARVASPQHAGLAEVSRDCPALEQALDALGVRSAFADGSAERLDVTSLHKLATLTRAAHGPGPDPAALEAILRGMQEPAAPQSWWQRFKNVVRQWLGSGGERAIPAWLSSWLERLTPGRFVLEVIAYAVAGAIVVLAGFIIWREVRAAGTGRTRRTRDRAGSAAVPEGAPPDLDPLQSLLPRERPRALFRLIAARLAETGRLPADRSLTHRQLGSRAQLPDPDQRATWRELARLAELQTYAADGAEGGPEPAYLLAEAERLLLPLAAPDRTS